MKKQLIFLVLATILLLSWLLFPEVLPAQPPPPPEKPGQTPIDGGLGLLAAAGGAYAIKKLKDRKK